MISIKPGAKLDGLRPEMVLAVVVAGQVYESNQADLVVTEGTGGQHMAGSLHASGRAVDLRTGNLKDSLGAPMSPAGVQSVVLELKRHLGANYDVVLETASPHIHVEFDPKV